MAIPGSAQKTKQLIVFGLVLGSLVPSDTFGVEVSAGITAGVSYTDNVFLVPPPDEVEDIVFSLSPWVMLSHQSAGLDTNIRYQYDWYEL
jgi:hypothetical protein